MIERNVLFLDCVIFSNCSCYILLLSISSTTEIHCYVSSEGILHGSFDYIRHFHLVFVALIMIVKLMNFVPCTFYMKYVNEIPKISYNHRTDSSRGRV